MSKQEEFESDEELQRLINHAASASPAPSASPSADEPMGPSPDVGPAETFTSRAVSAIPLGNLITNISSATLLHMLSHGGERAELTQAARDELLRRNEEVPESPSIVDTYRGVRDERREREDAGAEQNKTAGRLGTAAGIGLSILAPLPKVTIAPRVAAGATQATRGAQMLARLQSGAATGAAYGALGGATDGNADLTQGEVGKAAGETVSGAAIGAGLGTLGGLAAEGIAGLAPWLQRKAIGQARAALDPSSSLRQVTMKAADDEAMLEVLRRSPGSPRRGLIRPFSTTPDNYVRVDAAAEQEGAQLGQIIRDLEAEGVKGPRAKEISRELLRMQDAELNTSLADERVANIYLNSANAVTRRVPANGRGRLGLQQTEEMKRKAFNLARLDKLNNSPTEEANHRIGSLLRQANEDSIAEYAAAAGNGTPVDQLSRVFVPQKQTVGRLISARDVAERGANKMAHKSGPGLIPTLLASAAGGNPVTGYVTAMGLSGAMNRLPSTLAPHTFALSEALGGSGAAGSVGRVGEWAGLQGPESAQDWADDTAVNPEAGKFQRFLAELLRRRPGS